MWCLYPIGSNARKGEGGGEVAPSQQCKPKGVWRDAVHSLDGIDYATMSGRGDARVSGDTDVIRNLPAPPFNTQQLVQNFTSEGLTKRLYNFSKKSQLDPSMDKEFAHH